MDYSENELETESEEDDDNEDETSGSEEGESEDESGDEDEIVEEIETVLGEDAESLKAFSSDDDPERECCPICLNKFFGQDLGTPESCDHTFCFECIKEWSKNINTCPIDRTEFNYIHMKVSSGGVVLRKVEVKVAPKEPENALEEIPTLCEICHSGDREDRLLLCDGCDLAYHCECLDPPLFYIPIEEWFCPPCSGVFDRRGVAGSSRSGTRRVIPRTRASEAVRSRVQNRRTIRTPKTPSTSQTRQTSTQNKPKRKRRRYYRKAIRTIVPLARTKKDMNSGKKGKLGARGSTVIVTYRRRRYKRRRKVSKRSVASSKGIPSSKQRLAKHLGIGKRLGGSSVPQVKNSSGSRSQSTAIKARLPSHSLFGNKDQLMDFSENFNEDLTGVSSTSFSKSPKRPSTDARPSTSSGINILDSILAGQKILQAKSDKILIKTDGSLILKDEIKKQNTARKIEKDPPSRMPMSIALAKQGIRTSLLDKNLQTSCKKHADTSKTKNTSEKKILKSSTNSLFESRSSFDKIPSESSSKSKLFEILNDGKKKFSDTGRKNSLSSTKTDLGIRTRKAIVSEIDHSNSFTDLDGVLNDISSSDNGTTIANSNKSNHLNVALKIKSKTNKYSVKNCHTEFDSVSDNCNTTTSSVSPTSCKASTKSHIKREILSDDETTNDSVTHVQKVYVKQEILSDEETNIDSWNKPTDNLEQTFNNLATNIKKEPIDPDLKTDSIKDYKNVEINESSLFESNENSLSDFDASQSIIDSASHDMSNNSQISRLSENAKFVKVKEEIPSDSEDYSQSLILDSTSENLKRLTESKSLLSIKKEPFDPNDNVNNSEKENVRIRHHQNKSSVSNEPLESRGLFPSNFSKNADNLPENELPCTQAVVPISNSESDDDDDDIPCGQGSPQAALTDSEDDDIPCTQAFPNKVTYTDSEDDDIPCTQAFPQVPAVDSGDDDDLPCTQAPVQAAIDSKVDDLPCTQAVSFATVDSDADDSLPCTQAVFNISSNSRDDIQCAQAAFMSSKNGKKNPVMLPSSNNSGIRNDSLPPTQNALCTDKNKDIVSEATRTKNDFEFKKPSAISIRKSFSGVNNNNEYNKNASKASTLPTLPETELPPTQAVTFSACANKNKSSNQMSNVLNCVETDNAGLSFDLDDIDSSLPSTQVFNSNTKHISELSDTADVNFNLELSDIPTTQACNAKSQNVDDIAACETQIIKASTDKEISNIQRTLSLSDSFDLPPTQISNISSNEPIVPSIGIDVSSTQANENTQCDVPDTQVLPNTQVMQPNLRTASANDDQDDSICKNMTEIISNIKQLVNSLSSNNLENPDLQNTSNKEVSNNEPSSDCSKDRTSNGFSSLDKNVSSEKLKTVQLKNSKNALTEGSENSSSTNNTEKENKNSAKSSDESDNEEFSLEKLKEALKNSKPVTPKKTGIHKHLPQVIATVPVKENVKIKPSNKRTFSFEEVAKLEGPNVQQKPSKSFSSKFEIPDKIPENSSSDSNDLDDSLPATQMFETVNNKQSNIENQTLIKNHFDKQHDFQSRRSSTQENDDFPATQAVEKNSYLSNEKNKSKSMNSTDFAEPDFIKNEKNNATKRKNSFDEIIVNNKRNCNQMKDKSHIKEKNTNVNEQKNRNTCSKNSRECEEVEIINSVENSFSRNCKQRNMVCDKKLKPKIDKKPSVTLDCEKASSSEIIDLLKENCTSKKITIKQEKNDFEFVKPSTNVRMFSSSTPVSCLNLNVIKVEKVDPDDDFLPPTQAVNFNHSEDNTLPETQLTDTNLSNKNINENNDSKFFQSKLLLPTQIKKEPCSGNNDDEVSIIELDTASDVKVKEEIILIDDDDVESYKRDSSLVNSHIDQRKEMSSGIVHVSSVKKENCSEPRTVLESKPEIESLNVASEKSENVHLKHSTEHKRKGNDTAKSKNNQQNHEPKNNKRSSTECVSSNENVKRSKDSHASKEKIISLDQHVSELKRKSKDHHDSKEKISVSKTLVSKEKNKTSEDKKEYLKNSHILEKKDSCSKDSKSSKKEFKNLCNSQTSKEKIRKESKDSRKDLKVKPNHISKENNDKINKTGILKSQPKDKNGPMESASKVKDKSDKWESLPKSIKSNAKHSEKFKEPPVRKDSSGSADVQPFENGVVKNEKDSEKHSERESNKHNKEVTLDKKTDKPSEKDRCSSEKENRSKNNKEVIITLKPVNKKRSHNDISDQYSQKKRKLGHSLDSDSNSSEDMSFHLTELPNDFYKYSNMNADMQLKCDEIYNKLSASKDTDNAIGKSNELFSKPCQTTDIKKVHSKQNLKEEIANQVKLVLKPFYNTGLISKEDYKDIMRRSVPKIYTNCHNLINPEKIRKLVLNYVSLLSDKS